MEGYTDNSQILNYNFPLFFFIIHVDHTHTNNTPKMFIWLHIVFRKYHFICNISPKIHNLHCNTGAHSFFKSQESHFFPLLLLILQ